MPLQAPTLTSSRLVLRPWEESDAQVLFTLAGDPIVGERAGWPPHQSLEESLEVIRNVFSNPTTWAIVWRETGEVVGAIGYGPSCQCSLPVLEDEPLVGYWVGRRHWNKGICSEALVTMIYHIRCSTSIASLASGHFIDNPASGRVMEKCGFTATGYVGVDPTLYKGEERPVRMLRLWLKRNETKSASHRS